MLFKKCFRIYWKLAFIPYPNMSEKQISLFRWWFVQIKFYIRGIERGKQYYHWLLRFPDLVCQISLGNWLTAVNSDSGEGRDYKLSFVFLQRVELLPPAVCVRSISEYIDTVLCNKWTTMIPQQTQFSLNEDSLLFQIIIFTFGEGKHLKIYF